MSTHEDLLQASISWLKVGTQPPGGPPLTDQQIIFARQTTDPPGERPAKPYLTVDLLLYDTPQGEDDEVPSVVGTDPSRIVRGLRAAQLSVQGFGLDTRDWLETAATRLRHDSIKVLHQTLGITVDTDGGVTDLSALLDTGFEDRFVREFAMLYMLESAEETMSEAATVETTATFTSPSGDLVEVIIEPEP
jgi:hypothetical protein